MPQIPNPYGIPPFPFEAWAWSSGPALNFLFFFGSPSMGQITIARKLRFIILYTKSTPKCLRVFRKNKFKTRQVRTLGALGWMGCHVVPREGAALATFSSVAGAPCHVGFGHDQCVSCACVCVYVLCVYSGDIYVYVYAFSPRGVGVTGYLTPWVTWKLGAQGRSGDSPHGVWASDRALLVRRRPVWENRRFCSTPKPTFFSLRGCRMEQCGVNGTLP